MTIANVRIHRGKIEIETTDEGGMKIVAINGGLKRVFKVKECSKATYRKGILRAKKWIETGV